MVGGMGGQALARVIPLLGRRAKPNAQSCKADCKVQIICSLSIRHLIAS